jgi:hypothetical protein
MSHWEFQIELYCSAIIHSFARNSTNSLLHAVDFSLRYYSGLPATCTVFLNKLKIEHGSTKASIFKNLHAVVKAWLCRFSIEWSAFLMSRAKPWKRRSSAGANGDVAGGFFAKHYFNHRRAQISRWLASLQLSFHCWGTIYSGHRSLSVEYAEQRKSLRQLLHEANTDLPCLDIFAYHPLASDPEVFSLRFSQLKRFFAPLTNTLIWSYCRNLFYSSIVFWTGYHAI